MILKIDLYQDSKTNKIETFIAENNNASSEHTRKTIEAVRAMSNAFIKNCPYWTNEQVCKTARLTLEDTGYKILSEKQKQSIDERSIDESTEIILN